jgi:hypothetical protein
MEVINVSWDQFQQSAVSAFRSLEGDEHFTDVTLASGDGGQVRAHKVVLSSCSAFFNDILIQNPHPHPLIYLASVNLEELKFFIKFIYTGEASIAQENLDRFMETAKRFHVKGLGDQNDEKKENVEEIGERQVEDKDEHEDGLINVTLKERDRIIGKYEDEKRFHIKVLGDEHGKKEENVEETDEDEHDLMNVTPKEMDEVIAKYEDEQKSIIQKDAFKHNLLSTACSVCQKNFTHRRNMLKHKRKMHPKTKDNHEINVEIEKDCSLEIKEECSMVDEPEDMELEGVGDERNKVENGEEIGERQVVDKDEHEDDLMSVTLPEMDKVIAKYEEETENKPEDMDFEGVCNESNKVDNGDDNCDEKDAAENVSEQKEQFSDQMISTLMNTMSDTITITKLAKTTSVNRAPHKMSYLDDNKKVDKLSAEIKEEAENVLEDDIPDEIESKANQDNDEDMTFLASLSVPKNQCDICFKVFTVSSSVGEHKLAVHEGIKFPCDLCAFEASSKRNLRGHLGRVHTSKNKDVQVKTKNTFKKRTEIKEKTNFSLLDSDTQSLLKSVKEKAKGLIEVEGDVATCKECGKSSPAAKRWHLYKHAETHLQGIALPCTACGQVCSSSSALQQHILSKHGKTAMDGDYECKLCGHKSSSKRGLESHKYRKHRGGQNTNGDNCDFEASSVTETEDTEETDFEDTINEPTEDGEEAQTYVGEPTENTEDTTEETTVDEYETMEASTEDLGIETEENAVDKEESEEYVNASSDDNAHICDQCGEQASSVKVLIKHRNEEHPGAPFFCQECSKDFRTYGHLIRHTENVHLGEKTPCNYCTHEASSKYNLVRHVKKVHSM